MGRASVSGPLAFSPPCRRWPAVVTSKPLGVVVGQQSLAQWNPLKQHESKKRRVDAYELESDAPVDLFAGDSAGVRRADQRTRRRPGAASVGRLQFVEEHAESRQQVERRPTRRDRTARRAGQTSECRRPLRRSAQAPVSRHRLDARPGVDAAAGACRGAHLEA